MVDFVKIRLLLIKTNICRRLLGKQLLRMRCSCSKTRSGTEFSANTIFKEEIDFEVIIVFHLLSGLNELKVKDGVRAKLGSISRF